MTSRDSSVFMMGLISVLRELSENKGRQIWKKSVIASQSTHCWHTIPSAIQKDVRGSNHELNPES